MLHDASAVALGALNVKFEPNFCFAYSFHCFPLIHFAM